MLVVCYVWMVLCVCKCMFLVVLMLICVSYFFCSDNRNIQAMDVGRDVVGAVAHVPMDVQVGVGTVTPVGPVPMELGAKPEEANEAMDLG